MFSRFFLRVRSLIFVFLVLYFHGGGANNKRRGGRGGRGCDVAASARACKHIIPVFKLAQNIEPVFEVSQRSKIDNIIGSWRGQFLKIVDHSLRVFFFSLCFLTPVRPSPLPTSTPVVCVVSCGGEGWARVGAASRCCLPFFFVPSAVLSLYCCSSSGRLFAFELTLSGRPSSNRTIKLEVVH